MAVIPTPFASHLGGDSASDCAPTASDSALRGARGANTIALTHS